MIDAELLLNCPTSPCDSIHASKDALPLCVVALGLQQKNPYPSWVCAHTLTVYVVAVARPVSVYEP